MTTRLLMVGLDAADAKLVERYMIEGTMPYLSRLKDRGLMKRLSSSIISSDDDLWASFQYGESLDEHGRYHYNISLSNNSLEKAYKRDLGKTFFWNKVIGQHLRKAIIDIPKCAEAQILNGIHLADWIVHGRYFKKPISFPPEIAGDVIARFGPALPSRCDYFQESLNDANVAEIVSNLRESTLRKRAAGLHFLNAESWDLFLIGFKEAHCASHGLWNLIDKNHLDYNEQLNLKLGEPIKFIFSNIDAAIGDLINTAGPHTEIVVFSTTNMTSNGTLNHLLPKIINKINQQLGAAFCSILPSNDNCGALRINAIKEEKEYIANLICQMLKELTDVDTNQNMIEIITSPFINNKDKKAKLLPDLLFAYKPNFNPYAIQSPLLGIIAADTVRNIRPGNHCGGGFLIAAGNKAEEFAKNVMKMEDFAEMTSAILQ